VPLPRLLLLALLCASPVAAQELEPRAYSASPIGANFVLAAVGRSSGDVIFDPTVPITDVRADLYSTTVGVGRTFSLGGRLALLTAGLPYVWGTIGGKVAEQAQSITRSGLADARVKLSVNLIGTPALPPAAYVKAPRRAVVGASLTMSAPAGQYYGDKLINVGTHRWAFKPEVGVSYPAGRWQFDGAAGVWLFTDNDQFFPGSSTRAQNPLIALQTHISYNVTRRMWAAADATWYDGADVRVNDGAPASRQNNARVGATLSLPIAASQSVKVSFSTGASTRTGSDFTTVGVAWQYLWFDRPRASRP